ncbi:MAG: hypothetical protein PUB75_00665 [Firmicutes bacterium]|nr:hypothetical protein [Bacillota bacterium]
MKIRNRARSSSLFLLELIIAILFFSIASAVCVQFFVKSHTMSQDSKNLNLAVNECSSIAEIVQTSDSSREALREISMEYPDIKTDGNKCVINLETYSIYTDFTSDNGLITCTMDASYPGSKDSFYHLEVKHNVQKQ